MTVKKAASWCIGLGAALALFGAAAGLSRPNDVAPGGSSMVRQEVLNALQAEQAKRIADDAPRGETAVAPVRPARSGAVEGARPLTANQATPPAAIAPRHGDLVVNGVRLSSLPPRPIEVKSSAEMPGANPMHVSLETAREWMRSSTAGVVTTVSGGGARIVAREGQVVKAQPNFDQGGPEDVVPACSTTQSVADECGEDIYHQDGNASNTFVFAFDGGFGSPTSFLNDEIQRGVYDDAVLESPVPGATNTVVCGVTIGYATNNPDLHRITFKIRQPGMGLDCDAANPSSQPAIVNETWCTRGSTLPPDQVEFIFTTFTFAAPITVPLGPSALDIRIQSTYAEPPVDPANQVFGLILQSPGNDDLDGTLLNDNGNEDCAAIYSDNFFAGGLFFGGFPANPYSGYAVRIHTTDYLNNFNSTTGGNETAPTACDIDRDNNAANGCDAGTGAGAGVLNVSDSDTLSALINANFALTINDVGFTAVRCADMDRNGRIDCNDWNTYVAVCQAVGAVPAAMVTRGCNDTISNFTSGGLLAAPPGETPATLPIAIPDNNPFGRTNTQNVGTTPPNGIADLDVDLWIDHTFNTDLVAVLAHSGVTRTIVDQPLARNGAQGFTGMRVLLDDGEADGSGGPGGGLTLPIEFSRSNFRVFGRYEPANALSAWVGRIYGGGTNGTGTGAGDWRLIVSDRIIGDSGSLTQWSLHVKLGTPTNGVVVAGNDQFRNLGCRTPETAGATYFRFGQPAGTDPANPIPAIPAGFFDTTSLATNATVSFEGSPIDAATSDADMLTTRPTDRDLTTPGLNTGEWRIRDINLRSCTPLLVSYSDRSWPESWNVTVDLDPLFQVTPGGTLTLYANGAPDTSTDGRYWASMRLVPTFIFSKACAPSTVIRWGPNEPQVLNVQLDMSLGDEVNGTANPPCNAGSFPCRGVYVTDPNRGGQALGANPNAILTGDTNFVMNVSAAPALAKTESTLRAREEVPPASGTFVARDWFSIGYRSTMRIPMCPIPPVNEKALPCDMVCGTWGISPAFIQVLPISSGANNAGPPTNAVGGFITSDSRSTIFSAAVDMFSISSNAEIVRVFWWGGYQSNDLDGGGPTPANAVPDTFQDAFTVIFWNDSGSNPPTPTFGAAVGTHTQGSFTSFTRTFTGTSLNLGLGAAVRVYRYEATLSTAQVLPAAGTTRYWCEISNNTENTVPPITGIATIGGRWFWFPLTATGFGDGQDVSGGRNTLSNAFSPFGPALAYQLFQQIPETREYCGDSSPNACVASATGLSYRMSGVADGRGALEINGVENKPVSPLLRNRWNLVVAPVKPGTANQYKETLITAPANNASVATALNALLASKAPGLVCEVGAIQTALGTAVTDRVFHAKIGYDNPNTVSGTIDQICRQPDGQDYSGGVIAAGFALSNNLDVFGIAIQRTLTTAGPIPLGLVVYFVKPQDKDCNGNSIDDSVEIFNGTQEDCNADGIPDICQVPPICPSCVDCNSNSVPDECEADCNTNGVIDGCDVVPIGTFADCDTNGTPDICQVDCDNDGTIDPCQVAGNPLSDCNSNTIPDTCETQGVFVNAPNIPNPGFATIVGGNINFNSPTYATGAIDPGNMINSPGQQGWDLVFGNNFNIIGTPSLNPTTGGQIVNSGVACGAISGQWLRLLKDAGAGSSTFWSYGYQSPIFNNGFAGLTQVDVSVLEETGAGTSDRESFWLLDDAGFQVMYGLRLRKINATDTGVGVWTFNAAGIDTDGFQIPFNTCVRFRLELDDIDLQTATPCRLFVDTGGTGSNFVLIREDGPNDDGGPLRPTRVAIGAGDTAAASATAGTNWDNIQVRIATPFDNKLATCGGSGTKNGCRIAPIGVEQDCNCNGRPDACDIPAICTTDTFAPPSLPRTSTTQPTTRPCSVDCNSNSVPDECEVGAAGTVTRMLHTFETVATPPPPNFQFPSSVIGQPTTDPLADGAAGWTVSSALVPDALSAQVSATAFCPVVPGNERSIGLFVDPALATDTSGAWSIISANFGLADSAAHLSRQRASMDILIQPGKAGLTVRPAGDTFVTTFVRFVRAGINYTNDFDANGNAQGFLQQNEVQVAFGVTTTGAAAFTPLPGITWTENQCMRLVIETDLCRNPASGGLFDFGENVLVGIDKTFDGDFADAGETSVRVGDFGSTNMRNIQLTNNNQIAPNPVAQPGGIFVDNVTIIESDDYCDTLACSTNDGNANGIPDSCEVPACATCPGDVNGDGFVRGNDIRGYVGCLFAGPGITAGCGCADMDGNNAINSSDTATFVNELLGRNPLGDSNPACP